MLKVSALVSTYNSEQFLRGCLDDLISQTLWDKGELEIIVVNAGSKQHEARILREYLADGIPLQVITSLREPLYASWNRAIQLATGDYLTSANTDDRHRPDALEVLSSVLDEQPDIGLAYADCYVTDTPNAVWGGEYHTLKTAPYPTGRLNWSDFDPLRLLEQCYVGPQPVWRKALHSQIGLFDERFQLAGDFEMWLRMVATGIRFQRVPEVLGLFYAGGMGMANEAQSHMESRLALLRWRERIQQVWQTLPQPPP